MPATVTTAITRQNYGTAWQVPCQQTPTAQLKLSSKAGFDMAGGMVLKYYTILNSRRCYLLTAPAAAHEMPLLGLHLRNCHSPATCAGPGCQQGRSGVLLHLLYSSKKMRAKLCFSGLCQAPPRTRRRVHGRQAPKFQAAADY